MIKTIFNNISEVDRNSAIESVIRHATPRKDFFIMLLLSVIMATFGILVNSTIILVGSMLIAPLLFPLLSLALGFVAYDSKLTRRSLYTLIKSIFFALVASFLIGLMFTSFNQVSVGLSVFTINLPYFFIYTLVAATAGFAASFAITKPHLNETLPGVAISVSLVPPLAAVGIALSLFNWTLFSGALLLFIINVIGIVLSSMMVFSFFNFSTKGTMTNWLVEGEEEEVKKEQGVENKV